MLQKRLLPDQCIFTYFERNVKWALSSPFIFWWLLLYSMYLCFMTSALLFLYCVPKISSQNVQVKEWKKQPLTFAIFLRKKNLCTTFYAFYILTLISTGCSQKKCHNTLYTVTSLHILANFVYFLWVGGSFYKLVIHMTYRS